VAPTDGVGVMTEVVVGESLQPFQLGVDGGSTGEVGVESGWLGVHRGLRVVIDDAIIQALFDQEAKPLLIAMTCWRQNGDNDRLDAQIIVGG